MSRSDRDQRGRRHSGKNCPESQNGGCVYCNTGEYKRALRRKARAIANTALRKEHS